LKPKAQSEREVYSGRRSRTSERGFASAAAKIKNKLSIPWKNPPPGTPSVPSLTSALCSLPNRPCLSVPVRVAVRLFRFSGFP
ncbi:MAG: hypothetical protein WAO89_09675, partial [Kiritimatiellia bacterium]